MVFLFDFSGLSLSFRLLSPLKLHSDSLLSSESEGALDDTMDCALDGASETTFDGAFEPPLDDALEGESAVGTAFRRSKEDEGTPGEDTRDVHNGSTEGGGGGGYEKSGR